MAPKTSQLQIRVTMPQKRRLRRLAAAAGQDMSSYVLARALPDDAGEFAAIVSRLRGTADPSFTFAKLHDFLDAIAPADLDTATSAADIAHLPAFEANYVAAMVEHAAGAKRVPVPAWTAGVAPLGTPYFATRLKGLRLHLLRASPVPFKRRNLFVDSAVGDRV